MKTRIIAKLSGLALGLLLLAACTTTKVLAEWRNAKSTDARFGHIMVVALFKQDQSRHMFEDEFAWQLSNQGQMVTRSYMLTPVLNESTTDRIATVAKAVKADGVLVIRMLACKQHTKTAEDKSPLAPMNLTEFLQYAWKDTYDPPDLMTNAVMIAESRLFDAKSEKLAWSLITETKPQFGLKWEIFFFAKRILGEFKDAMQTE